MKFTIKNVVRLTLIPIVVIYIVILAGVKHIYDVMESIYDKILKFYNNN